MVRCTAEPEYAAVCFSFDLVIRVIIFIAFVVLCIAIFNLWMGDWLTGMTPYGAKLVLTLKWIFGFIIFCCIIWFLFDMFQCFMGGSAGYGRLR